MIVRIVRRLIAAAATVACIYVITFVMVVSIPGDPFQQGQHQIPRETRMALEARYSMDNNWAYLGQFLAGALRFDFGPSFAYGDWTCDQIIAESLPISMMIGFLAVTIALLIGVPLGVLGAVRRHGWLDATTLGVVFLGISLPTFVTGSALLTVFSVFLRIAPAGGWGTLAHLPLPALTLSLPFIAYIARLTRMGMLDVLSSDFVRTALAKGVSRQRAIWTHALRVAILPVVSFLGPATAQAMTGSFVVEEVFGVPGIGQHFVNAALNRDVGLVMSTVFVFSTVLVFLNVAVDLLYSRLDPRIENAV